MQQNLFVILTAVAAGVDAGRIFNTAAAGAVSTVKGRSFATSAPLSTGNTGNSGPTVSTLCKYFPFLSQCKSAASGTGGVSQGTSSSSSYTFTSTSSATTTTPQPVAATTTLATTTAPATTPAATTPASTAPASLKDASFPYVDQQAFVSQMLDYHNQYRARHGAPALTWSTTLAQQALQWANGKSWSHTPNNPNGENLATGTYTNPAKYVFMWYDEVRMYDYSKPGFTHDTGHFTQLVWKSTSQVGCAMTNTATTDMPTYPYYLVCEYSGPGNIVNDGYFANNVLQPLSSIAYPSSPAGNL
ncbi:sterol-binding protein [Savitreella phatthalungensis]